jgi:hypothetical protein
MYAASGAPSGPAEKTCLPISTSVRSPRMFFGRRLPMRSTRRSERGSPLTCSDTPQQRSLCSITFNPSNMSTPRRQTLCKVSDQRSPSRCCLPRRRYHRRAGQSRRRGLPLIVQSDSSDPGSSGAGAGSVDVVPLVLDARVVCDDLAVGRGNRIGRKFWRESRRHGMPARC